MQGTIANVQQYDAWNSWEGEYWAEHTDRFDGMLGDFNTPVLDAAAVGETDRILDVGCGCGQLTRQAARFAVRGHAHGIDLSGPMLARARDLAAAEGVDNVTFEQGDAQVHPFPAGAYDVAISRGGVMFFADLVAGFTTIARTLRPGGRLSFIGPRPTGPDSAYARATAALAPYLRGPSPAGQGMMALVDPDRIRAVVTEAGFAEVDVQPFEGTETLGADAAEAAEFVGTMPPVTHNLRDLDQATRDRLRSELVEGFRPHETPAGVRLPGTVWLVTAVRP